MIKITYLFLSFLLISATLADDCLNNGTSPTSALKDTNFDELQALSMNVKNKMGGPEKGFYVEISNKCKVDVNFALAFASWGSKDNIVSKIYYEPLLVQGWWNLKPESSQKIFFERKVTKTLAFHARSSNGMMWGKDNIQYTVPGPDGGKAYPFIEYETEKKCKGDYENVVTCSISVACK